jgi:hypothetical protein
MRRRLGALLGRIALLPVLGDLDNGGGQVSNGIRLQRVGVRRGVAKVTEYRAISAVWVRIRWGRSA